MPPIVLRTSAPVSIEDLVRLAGAGDPLGIGGLYDHFAERMVRVAWRLTGSMEDAEDVVHDVFVGLPEALRRYREQGSIEAWLSQVTARAALMRIRESIRRRESSLVDLDHVASTPRTDLAAEYRDVEQHIFALPEALRTVFVLREMEGFTHDEIAALVGISAGASRVRLSRALDALRAVLCPASVPHKY
jgi:RNA polymerase sigma-70 factor (ECF subfamily)